MSYKLIWIAKTNDRGPKVTNQRDDRVAAATDQYNYRNSPILVYRKLNKYFNVFKPVDCKSA